MLSWLRSSCDPFFIINITNFSVPNFNPISKKKKKTDLIIIQTNQPTNTNSRILYILSFCLSKKHHTQPLDDRQNVTQGQMLSRVQQVWIQSFPSPQLAAKLRLKNQSIAVLKTTQVRWKGYCLTLYFLRH